MSRFNSAGKMEEDLPKARFMHSFAPWPARRATSPHDGHRRHHVHGKPGTRIRAQNPRHGRTDI